jgi:N-acetylglutamate synthase-like GNAT family acetyltransferase
LNISIEKIKFSDLIPIKKAVEKTNIKLVDKKNTTWFGAMHNGKLVGICAFTQKKDVLLFNSIFVLEAYRRKGIYRQLFAERLQNR